MRECISWTPNQEKLQWRLLNAKIKHHCDYQQIQKQFDELISYIPRFSDPNLFSATTHSRISIIARNIRFTEYFMLHIPDILALSAKYALDHDGLNQTAIETLNHNEMQYLSAIFGEPHYDLTEASFKTSFFPFTEILVYASRQIMDIIRTYENYHELSEFHLWTFVYQFMFDYYIKTFDQELYPPLPTLDKIYYLEDNSNNELSDQQLRFIQELSDKFGVIFYHDITMDNSVNISETMDVYLHLEDFADIKAQMMDVMKPGDLDDTDAFIAEFEVGFLSWLLQNCECDLNLVRGHERKTLIGIIDNTVRAIMDYGDPEQQLVHFWKDLQQRNGLKLLTKSKLIKNILVNNDYTYHDCICLLETSNQNPWRNYDI